MGEIADALRRAREGRKLEQRSRGREVGRTAHAPLRARSRPPGPDPSLADLERPARDPSVGEACRRTALAISRELESRGIRLAAIVGAEQGVGKTTVACDLALALASLGTERSVALIDLDLRKPDVARSLGLRPRSCLSLVLRGEASLEEVCISLRLPQLDVYPVVHAQRAAHELFVSGRFRQMLSHLEQRYETVLFDTPPVLGVADTSLIMRQVASCIPVARVGYTRTRAFQQMMSELPADRVLGVVINGARLSRYASYEYGAGQAEAAGSPQEAEPAAGSPR